MLGNLQAPEIILIVVVVLLLFGAKRLPDTARGLGRSLRIFKAETKGLREDETPAAAEPPAITPAATTPVVTPLPDPTQPVQSKATHLPSSQPAQPGQVQQPAETQDR